jgi:hypothetical protein
MRSAVNVWRENLQSKVADISRLVLEYLTNRDDSLVPQIQERIAGLKSMFGPKQTPHELRVFENNLNGFLQGKNRTDLFLNLMKAYQTLPAISDFDDAELVSFDAIFESYKADEALNALVDELVGLIEKILAEGDATLSAQIARELGNILQQLKRRQKYSLYELQNWIDLGARALLCYLEAQSGAHGLQIAYEAVKLSFKIKGKLMDQYAEAQKRLTEQGNLAYVAKAMNRVPELRTYEEAQKFLADSSISRSASEQK